MASLHKYCVQYSIVKQTRGGTSQVAVVMRGCVWPRGQFVKDPHYLQIQSETHTKKMAAFLCKRFLSQFRKKHSKHSEQNQYKQVVRGPPYVKTVTKHNGHRPTQHFKSATECLHNIM